MVLMQSPPCAHAGHTPASSRVSELKQSSPPTAASSAAGSTRSPQHAEAGLIFIDLLAMFLVLSKWRRNGGQRAPIVPGG